MRSSENFIMSVDPLSSSDIRRLVAIKQSVKATNKITNIKSRVVVRGREAVEKINNQSYDRFGNIVGGLGNACRFDVYIYQR
jgi:hypothetical protein